MDDIILVILAIWLALKLEIISVALRSVICKVTFAKKQKQNKHKMATRNDMGMYPPACYNFSIICCM